MNKPSNKAWALMSPDEKIAYCLKMKETYPEGHNHARG